MSQKFTNPKNYWKLIKPRIGDTKTYVAPEGFAEHFSQLYASQDSEIVYPDKNYVMYNDILVAAKQSSHESVTQFADRIELAALKITQHSDIKDKYYTSDAVLKAAFSKGLRDESLAACIRDRARAREG